MPFSTQTYLPAFDPVLCAFVRSLADQQGWYGFNGKDAQRNQRIRQKGYVRIVWTNRRSAKLFQRLVTARLGLKSRRFKVR